MHLCLARKHGAAAGHNQDAQPQHEGLKLCTACLLALKLRPKGGTGLQSLLYMFQPLAQSYIYVPLERCTSAAA